MKWNNGSIYKSRVWPGTTAYPDWFHENTQGYWNHEFDTFFNADTGVDIDALSVFLMVVLHTMLTRDQVDRHE